MRESAGGGGQERCWPTLRGSLLVCCSTIGAGTLALPWTFAQLGWIAGPCALLLLAAATLPAAHLQASLHDAAGRRRGLLNAVLATLGRRWRRAAALAQMGTIACVNIAYTVAAAMALEQLWRRQPQQLGVDKAKWWSTLFFGALQLLLSQLPGGPVPSWSLAAGGAAAGLGYCGVAAALSLLQLGTSGGGETSIAVGAPDASAAGKAFGVLTAFGVLAFATSTSALLSEITAALREPPAAAPERAVHRAINLGSLVTLAAYLLVATTGYLAGGGGAPANVLAAFAGPRWLVVLGNALLLAHMLLGFQLFARPAFVAMESHICYSWLGYQEPCPRLDRACSASVAAGSRGGGPCSPCGCQAAAVPAAAGGAQILIAASSSKTLQAAEAGCAGPVPDLAAAKAGRWEAPFTLPSPFMLASWFAPPACTQEVAVRTISLKEEAEALHIEGGRSPAPTWLKLADRSLYVLAATTAAVFVPDLAAFAGLAGALSFWPLGIAIPTACWAALHRPSGWQRWALAGASAAAALVSLAAGVGSARSLVVAWSSFSFS